MLLSDAQSAYDAHLKGSSDGTERKAWARLRNSKLLETRLKEAGYVLRVMTRQEAAAFLRPEGQEEQQLSQPGAAAAAAAGESDARAQRGAGRSAAHSSGSDNAFMILNRRWKGRPDEAEQPSAGVAVANIMDGGLPSTDGAFLSKQLAAMFAYLGGHFNTWNDEKFPYVGGALSKLVYYLHAERKRDINPAAAAGADEQLDYRPQPQLQVSIPPRERAPKRARHALVTCTLLARSPHSFSAVSVRVLTFLYCALLCCLLSAADNGMDAMDFTSDVSVAGAAAAAAASPAAPVPAAAAASIAGSQQSAAAAPVAVSQHSAGAASLLSFPSYDGFAAFQLSQKAAAAAASSAVLRFSAVPPSLVVPLSPSMDSEACYGKCPLAKCQLQRVAKMTHFSAGKGANAGRWFLTCRHSSVGNPHNAAFCWRDEWLEKQKLPLKGGDLAWRRRRDSIAAQLAAGLIPRELNDFSRSELAWSYVPPVGPHS